MLRSRQFLPIQTLTGTDILLACRLSADMSNEALQEVLVRSEKRNRGTYARTDASVAERDPNHVMLVLTPDSTGWETTRLYTLCLLQA